MLAEVEKAIATQLINSLKGHGVKAEAFPDRPQSNPRVTPKGRVLVAYQGSTFEEINEEPLSLWMDMRFGVIVQVANIRSHRGALPILDEVRTALTDFYPIGGPVRALQPVMEKFDDYDEDTGIWYYSAIYKFRSPWPADFGAGTLDAPVEREISNIEIGLWRSFIGHVGDQAQSTLDTTELAVDANP